MGAEGGVPKAAQDPQGADSAPEGKRERGGGMGDLDDNSRGPSECE